MCLIEAKDLGKIYKSGNVETVALHDVNFTIEEGEFVVIIGASGAGKSTLLNILGGMDTPTSGSFIVAEKDISTYDSKDLALYRRYDIGFVFQFYNLIASLTALENVSLARSVAHNPLNSNDVLKEVGLENRMNAFPSSLSGGEQQRVAIARAIVKNPTLLLCDEPTGALDSKTGRSIVKLLKNISKSNKKTVIIVTHNAALTEIADHVIQIQDGSIIKDYKNEIVKEVDELKW